ncbi:DUF4290 domain-containing protein [Hymenobacter sp. UV11]|uniref:DUF4290 domain-containing protein n=1 Tax=Hymenobacter sp. UV11 TaxID=1849735 RepID=UPI00105E568A|nr:DUF4290 domain-containing protein [Hymenobacter sp. UV11]TDN38538.1 hypothetical protein A8B98_23215 [Hymenobacter sp. UV11]TFZ65262.1 DUF4290 domain-containing protein [Hymenobacter sp. UV11]
MQEIPPTLPFHLQLLVREYGQSTYQLIQGLAQIEDVAERTRRAAGIVQMMLRLRPSLRDVPEIQTRLWNHLHALAGTEVALDAPVPLTPPRLYQAKPQRLEYPRQAPKLKAYGRGIEALIAKALTLTDAAEREQAATQIGRTMKFLYRQHNKENAKDVTIIRHLGELSGGQLKLDAQAVADQGLFELAALPTTAASPTPRPSGQSSSRDARDRRTDRPEGSTSFGNGGSNGKKRDKKRSKKFRSEPQQPPQ